MWQYEKRLEYPVNIKQTDPKTAQYILASTEVLTEKSTHPYVISPSAIPFLTVK